MKQAPSFYLQGTYNGKKLKPVRIISTKRYITPAIKFVKGKPVLTYKASNKL